VPPFGARLRIEFLLGMGRMGKKFCLILDIDRVLSAEEFLAVTDSAPASQDEKTVPAQSHWRAAESGA
jgi:purine-binding chemotaxis protein CheW